MPSCVLVVTALLGLTGCSLGADHAYADGVAQRLATAISYPRQPDAMSWARAAVGIEGDGGPVILLSAVDLETGTDADVRDPEHPTARLTFDVHRDATQDTFGRHPASDTCYVLALNRYGAIGDPQRVDCPETIRALRIPPAPARSEIPVGFDRTLTALLRSQPDDAATLRAAVVARLPAPLPRVQVSVDASRAGVALQDEDGDCLFGARNPDGVRVYSPPGVQVQPGEQSCDAATARGPVIDPAH